MRANIPVLSAALAISLEPTGWKGLGTVSREKDHHDKTLQDYILYSHFLQEDLKKICFNINTLSNYGKQFYELTKKYMRIFKTNLSFGSLFLIYYNTIAACQIGVNSILEIRKKAYSILLQEDPYWYYKSLKESNPKFILRYSSSLLPDLTTMNLFDRFFNKKRNLVELLRLNVYDPVSREAVESFYNTYVSSLKFHNYLLKKGKIFPDSESIDWLYLYHCNNRLDFLVYRKMGLSMAKKIKENCNEYQAEIKVSMGSIADLVVLSLFYYFLRTLSVMLENIEGKSDKI